MKEYFMLKLYLPGNLSSEDSVKACPMQRAVGLDSFLGRDEEGYVVMMCMRKRMVDLMMVT